MSDPEISWPPDRRAIRQDIEAMRHASPEGAESIRRSMLGRGVFTAEAKVVYKERRTAWIGEQP